MRDFASLKKIITEEFELLGDNIAELLLEIEMLAKQASELLSDSEGTIFNSEYIDDLSVKFDSVLAKRYKAIIRQIAERAENQQKIAAG